MILTEIFGQITGFGMDFRYSKPNMDVTYITTHAETVLNFPMNALRIPLKKLDLDDFRCKGVRITVETID